MDECGSFESTLQHCSGIPETFAGKTVFITGATGFLGTLLLEKLFRGCPDIKRIYITIRAKKGKNVEERKNELFSNEIFDPVRRSTNIIFENKVLVLSGDLLQPNLGLSEEDQEKVIEEVDVVFHLAATVRFDEKIKKAVDINIKATIDLLNIAKKMKQLKSFVYVSTAFSFCPLKEIDEKFYKPPYEPQQIIQMVEPMDEDLQEYIMPKLLKSWPNTYVLTKAVAEEVVRSESDNLPSCIFRPSIVISTYREPLAGWINNIYGPVGLLLGVGIGVIKVLWLKSFNQLDLVPADMVINGIIAAGWANITKRNNTDDDFEAVVPRKKEAEDKIKIYNCSSGFRNPMYFNDVVKYMGNTIHKEPPLKAIAYCSYIITENYHLFKILVVLLHTIPGHVFDFVAKCFGKKPQLVKEYKKLHKFMDILNYFAKNQWTFKDNNLQRLWANLSLRDQKNFSFDIKLVKWEEYLFWCKRGLRVYLLEDPMDTVDDALVRYRKLKIIHYTVLFFVAFLLFVVTFIFFKLISNRIW